jgi:hypothetical protein
MFATASLSASPSHRTTGAVAGTLGACALVVLALARNGAAPVVTTFETAPPRPAPVAAAFDDAGYLALSDRLTRLLDSRWDARAGRYRPGADLTETMTNANLLLVHAVAARHGHTSPARADARARAIVEWLVDSPVWVERAPRHRHKQGHAPGWVAETGGWQQHLVIDSEVVDGLTHAYRARRELGLPDRSVRLIRDRIHRLAAGPYWRWPAIRLNQLNWYVLVFAGHATVTGRGATLADGLRRHLDLFLGDVGRGDPRRRAGNLGPGLRFHYLPDEPVGNGMNLDTAEYANIVLSFSRFYDQAREAGMQRLDRRAERLLRDWVKRALAGYWTHGGYASWDTGHGFERLYQQKKLALMQQALMGVAAAGEIQPSPRWGDWAKWLLDRSLAWYDAEAARVGGVPDPVAFGVHVAPQSDADAALGAARMAANASRAVDLGLGRVRAARPPALYAYDPDTGRLAVTTPAYSTAIVPVNQGVFPYGGVEPARLMDGRGRVAATVGGRVPAAFGLVVRSAAGRVLLASQRGRTRIAHEAPALRLLRAPAGVGARADGEAGRAYAGPFTELVAEGAVHRGRLTATSRHRFLPAAIESRWSLGGMPPAGSTVEALFPTAGRSAAVTARLRDGGRLRLGARAVALARIARLEVASADGAGYTVTPLRRPAGATVRLVATTPQPSASTPGPTVAVRLPGAGAARAFAARVAITAGR